MVKLEATIMIHNVNQVLHHCPGMDMKKLKKLDDDIKKFSILKKGIEIESQKTMQTS